jgi:hypothetical protein
LSPHDIEVIEPRGKSWTRHVANLKYIRNAYKVFAGNPEGKRSLRNLRLGGRIIL